MYLHVCVVVVAPPSGWWEVKCDVGVPASAQYKSEDCMYRTAIWTEYICEGARLSREEE